jgi:hypothetical protein
VEPPRIKCRQIRAEGKLLLKEGAVSGDGRISTGDGEFERIGWKGLAFTGSLSADGVVARELVVDGTAYAPKIVASGKLQGETLSLTFAADRDQGEIGGRYRKNGDFEGRLRLEGPMAWLDPALFRSAFPRTSCRSLAEGKVSREKNDTAAMLEITGRADSRCRSPRKSAGRRRTGSWPSLPEPSSFRTGHQLRGVRLGAHEGRASVENLKVACTEPRISTRLSGTGSGTRRRSSLPHSRDEGRGDADRQPDRPGRDQPRREGPPPEMGKDDGIICS